MLIQPSTQPRDELMVHNMLKLNNENTNIIVLGAVLHRKMIDIPYININESEMAVTSTVNNLVVMFDREVNIKEHVNAINMSALILRWKMYWLFDLNNSYRCICI